MLIVNIRRPNLYERAAVYGAWYKGHCYYGATYAQAIANALRHN